MSQIEQSISTLVWGGGDGRNAFAFQKKLRLQNVLLDFHYLLTFFNLGFLFVMGNTYLLDKILARRRERIL